MKPEPAIYPAFCIHSFSLKLFISIYLKSVDQPARDSPHPPVPVRLGFLIAVAGAGSLRSIQQVSTESLGEVRNQDKGTNEGTISKSLCSLKDLRLLRALQILL